jgi:Domain of unknown function (DUF4145)
MAKGCGHCGFPGYLEEKGRVKIDEQDEEIEGHGWVQYFRYWIVARCPNCDRPTLDAIVFVDVDDDDPENAFESRIYPTLLENDTLPAGVRKQFEAAHRVRAIEPSFYAVGVRRMLEAVCSERGASGNTLEKQIKHLVDVGQLPDVFAGMAKQLRTLGNWGAHDGNTEVVAGDVPLIEEFADSILDYLYRAPAKLAAVETALQERIAASRTRSTGS